MGLRARCTRSWPDRRRVSLLAAVAAALTVAGAAPASASAYGVVAWGSNQSGQLGNGLGGLNARSPTLVRGLAHGAASVAAGTDHSLVLRSAGGVRAWGANAAGQLGNGTTEGSELPVAVSGLSTVRAISAGNAFSLALLSNGTVMAWGNNSTGQLGNGNFTRSSVPVAVRGLSTVTAVSAGADFSLALLSNGTVMAWGNNSTGQLGNGNFTSSNVPVEVRQLRGVTAIAAGDHFGLALLSSGTVMAWGDNVDGQLGNGNFTRSNVPVAVSALSAVTVISAGAKFSLALLSNGQVMAWGENRDGQLGNGTTETTNLPKSMRQLSGVTAISAGGNFSLALLNSGGVMATGANEYGQLGIGTTTSQVVPAAVKGLSGIVGISAGYRHSLAYGSLTPIVTSVSPASGPASGGTSVRITGSNFAGATAVKFGSASALSFTVSSGSSITAVAPPGIGTVDVLVRTPAGTSSSGSGDQYTYEGEAVPTAPYRGVNSHAPWYWVVSETDVKREIAEAVTLGVEFIRVPVQWAEIESGGEGVRGGKALARLDLIVAEAAAFGLKIDGTIATTPHWASPGGAWNDAPAEPERSLRGFARFLTQRYGTKLLDLGVLNEPNWGDNLRTPSGESLPLTEEGLKRRAYWYVKDVKAVYRGASEGNPTVKVLAGETAGADKGNALKFLSACFEGGLPHGEGSSQSGFQGFYDTIGAHVYAEGGPPESSDQNSTKSRIERLHNFLKEHEGTSSVPLWAGEWGYSLEDSETVRADYVKKAVEMLDTQFPYLEGWAYYQLRDPVYAPTEKEQNFGLLQYGFLPRLSFAAFKAALLE